MLCRFRNILQRVFFPHIEIATTWGRDGCTSTLARDKNYWCHFCLFAVVRFKPTKVTLGHLRLRSSTQKIRTPSSVPIDIYRPGHRVPSRKWRNQKALKPQLATVDYVRCTVQLRFCLRHWLQALRRQLPLGFVGSSESFRMVSRLPVLTPILQRNFGQCNISAIPTSDSNAEELAQLARDWKQCSRWKFARTHFVHITLETCHKIHNLHRHYLGRTLNAQNEIITNQTKGTEAVKLKLTRNSVVIKRLKQLALRLHLCPVTPLYRINDFMWNHYDDF